jgi:predicted NAD/FAD-binding protein
MRIAVIGAGIAGNTVAYQLHREHDVVVFEASDWVGGHTHTVDIEWKGRTYAIDTGFIVFNDWTYPRFIELLTQIGAASQPSTMSFSVRCERTGLEYNGATLNTLFAQRSNLFRPSFHRMLRDIVRFNREAPGLLRDTSSPELTLADYLREQRYAREFIAHYLTPMGAAIWSTDPARMRDCPARFFIQFFANHGMLSVNDRPQWRVLRGGSRAYVEKLTAGFRDRILTSTPVTAVRCRAGGVEVESTRGIQRFDAVFFACHSDQALRLIKHPTSAERETLSAIPYQSNDVVLHTDARLLPQRRRAWAAWNYHILACEQSCVAVTYNMNMLQSLDAPTTFCVTLNRTQDIDPRRILGRYTYHHPLYTAAAVAAQARQRELNGVRGLYFCGAYWRYGFHEDGVVSALSAVDHFRERQKHAQLSLRRLA